jgi:hypothetical protein
MAEHTPGTWVAKPHQFGGCWWVDTLHGSIQVSMKTLFKDDMDEANARFIAAAPDMEKALEMYIQAEDSEPSSVEQFVWAGEAARAALAKAKGEADA